MEQKINEVVINGVTYVPKYSSSETKIPLNGMAQFLKPHSFYKQKF